MDSIRIRDLTVSCIIGIEPKERVQKQEVCINLTLQCDLARAAASDDIAHAVDYKTIRDKVVEFVEKSDFNLIETLAARVASLCLEDRRIMAVTVCLDKPGALTRTRSVAVEIHRTQPLTRRKK